MRLLWFCYRVVVKTSGRTSVPNSKLSTPPPGRASQSRVGKSSTLLIFSSNFDQFYLFFLKLYFFSSSFWPSGWANRPPGKALATPLALPYFWSLCTSYASGPCILTYGSDMSLHSLHSTNLKYVSDSHSFQRGTECQFGTCFRTAQNANLEHVSEWHIFRMARNTSVIMESGLTRPIFQMCGEAPILSSVCAMQQWHNWVPRWPLTKMGCIYEDLISKTSYIHSYMLLICSSGHSKKPNFNTKFTANGKCWY